MISKIKTFFQKNLILILLFGSLIGLNEIVTGSISSPYRSVLVSTITIALLSFARFSIPKPGSSLLIIFIAILFKLNNSGFHTCTTNMLLCGPAALFIIGISYELFAGLFFARVSDRKFNYTLLCFLATYLSFSFFGFMNTFILGVWNSSVLIQYIFIKGTLTALFSGGLTYVILLIFNMFHQKVSLNVYVFNTILFILITGFWMLGSFRLL